MSYDPHVWNHMYERQDLSRCPFCGASAVEEQKGNKEREYRISCGNPHCEISPHTFAQYDLEEAVEGWQIRRAPITLDEGMR